MPLFSDIQNKTSLDPYIKTLHYRYFITPTVSPYNSSFTHDISNTETTNVKNKYSTFRTYFNNNTLNEPYYCPYTYNVGTSSTSNFWLKTAYDNATSLNANSISFINSIQGNSLTIKYAGMGKPFQSISDALANFNNLIDKIDAVVINSQYFLASDITNTKPSVLNTNLTDAYIKTGSSGSDGTVAKQSETTAYGKYGIFYDNNPGDTVTTLSSSGGSFTAPTKATNVTNYITQIKQIIQILSDIRNNPNFTSVNNENQPIQNTGDKRVHEVFDIIIQSLKISLVALKSSYKQIDPTKSTDIDANRKAIDSKMNELFQLPGTQIDSYKQYYTATMVAGAMWTVLATTLVYYVFNEL